MQDCVFIHICSHNARLIRSHKARLSLHSYAAAMQDRIFIHMQPQDSCAATLQEWVFICSHSARQSLAYEWRLFEWRLFEWRLFAYEWRLCLALWLHVCKTHMQPHCKNESSSTIPDSVCMHICRHNARLMWISSTTHAWVTSHMWLSNVTRMNESCCIYKWV